jgi:hypothetical protein
VRLSEREILVRLWDFTQVDPGKIGELLYAQERCDEVIPYVYPTGLSDRALLRLSFVLPPPLACSLLRERLIRGLARETLGLEAPDRARLGDEPGACRPVPREVAASLLAS